MSKLNSLHKPIYLCFIYDMFFVRVHYFILENDTVTVTAVIPRLLQ